MSIPLPQMDSLPEYSARFADVEYWRPYVLEVSRRHALFPCDDITCTNPGTYPTFIINHTWVVKFFGQMFNGQVAYAAEFDANSLISSSAVPAPALLLHGKLFSDISAWPWPYLVFQYVSGRSLGTVRADMRPAELLELARNLGQIVRSLHNTNLSYAAVHQPTWDTYFETLETRRADCIARQSAWAALPEHLLRQIPDYLMPVFALANTTHPPVLIHADITADHILLEREVNSWRISGLIDWGDALVGDPACELLALHMDAFRYDKSLLTAFINEYRLEPFQQAALPTQMMNLTLISQYSWFTHIFSMFPAAQQISTLGTLADWLFNPDYPKL